MILKTYARVVTENAERTLEGLRKLTGKEPDVRFSVGTTEIIAIADFCIVAAPKEQLTALREVVGPIIVDNLEELNAKLVEQGSEITLGPAEAPTGTVLYARNRDGIAMEWLQYTTKLTQRLFPGHTLSEVTP
jgi:hypothetical protein